MAASDAEAFVVTSSGVVPGLIGGSSMRNSAAAIRSRRAQLLDKMPDYRSLFEGHWVNKLMLVFNTTRKPFFPTA